jgi:RNA polymerase sigma-70 factor (ECF subfamily)
MENFIMITINLRDFYHWYDTDEFIEVSEEVAAEMFGDIRDEETYERVKRRYGVISLDVDDGTLEKASLNVFGSPEAYVLRMEQRCRLCHALNSLPEIQGRRIDAHFIQRISRKELALIEGVTESALNECIALGIKSMKKIFSRNFEICPVKTP